MWQHGTSFDLCCSLQTLTLRLRCCLLVVWYAVAERGDYVLSNCMVILQGDTGAPAAAPKPAAAKPAAAAAPAKPAAAAPAPAPAAAPAAAGGAGGKFAAEAVFAELKKSITADVVKQVNGTFRFDLTNGSAKRSWIVDLKTGSVR